MQIDQKEAKTLITTFSFTVEQGKIKELAQAIGDENPIYQSLEAAKAEGYRGIPAPPTFATVIGFWGGFDFDVQVEKLQLEPLKVLHGEQEYEYIDQIYAGDVLECEVYKVGEIDKRKMKLVIVETEYKRDGQAVLIARSTIIERK
ncbi:MAG TPA: MaoC family dehydratase N-terminal domain-containing protein [Chondromyces sp.]|nr:MaoC family dehydratase N-terminal domain-containing protein [Chondromyces sp.]